MEIKKITKERLTELSGWINNTLNITTKKPNYFSNDEAWLELTEALYELGYIFKNKKIYNYFNNIMANTIVEYKSTLSVKETIEARFVEINNSKKTITNLNDFINENYKG